MSNGAEKNSIMLPQFIGRPVWQDLACLEEMLSAEGIVLKFKGKILGRSNCCQHLERLGGDFRTRTVTWNDCNLHTRLSLSKNRSRSIRQSDDSTSRRSRGGDGEGLQGVSGC